MSHLDHIRLVFPVCHAVIHNSNLTRNSTLDHMLVLFNRDITSWAFFYLIIFPLWLLK